MITFLILRYLLVAQALVGCVLAARGLHTNLRDLRALDLSKQNGPKRLSTMLRIKIEAFLLAVFVVMVLIGAMFMLSSRALSDVTQIGPVILVGRIGWNIAAALLVTMQIMARKGRSNLDEYYDTLQRRSPDVDMQAASIAAQKDATLAQDHATTAQQEASSAQVTATLAQEAAIEASDNRGPAPEKP